MSLSLGMLAVAVLGTFGLVFLGGVALGRDAADAARQTANRSIGVATGSLGVAGGLAVGVIEPFMINPEWGLTLLGFAGIVGNFSVEAFLSSAILFLIMAALVEDVAT